MPKDEAAGDISSPVAAVAAAGCVSLVSPKIQGRFFFSSTLSDPSQMEMDLRAVDLYQLSVCQLMDSDFNKKKMERERKKKILFKTIHCGANTPRILVSLWDPRYHSILPLHIGDLQTEL